MASTRNYLVVIERAQDGSFSAYVPDLPGCVAVGQATPEAAKQLIREAIEVHIQGLIEDGLPVPDPSSRGEYVEAVAQPVEQVRKTLLHEIGHHFGMDEDDLDEVGYG